jgi:hypothetical protein
MLRHGTSHDKDLAEAQAKYKLHFDAHIKSLPNFKVGDLVWLLRRNISTTRPSPKLDHRHLGLFKILECIGESKLAFKLELPHTMRIHPVFHGSLLTLYCPNTIPGYTQPLAPPVTVDGHEEYEVSEILDSKIERGKLRYLVDWVGWGPEDRQWEPAEHLENSADAVTRFHACYLLSPSPADIQCQEPRPVPCPTSSAPPRAAAAGSVLLCTTKSAISRASSELAFGRGSTVMTGLVTECSASLSVLCVATWSAP